MWKRMRVEDRKLIKETSAALVAAGLIGCGAWVAGLQDLVYVLSNR